MHAYATENGTDIILSDRKKQFSDNKLSLCENNCNFAGYSQQTKQSYCDCNVKNKIETMSEIIDNPNKLSNYFSSEESSSTSSNLITLKCTKTLFTKKGLLYNISSYIFFFILTFFLVSILLFLKCGFIRLEKKINRILKKKRKYIKTETANTSNKRKKDHHQQKNNQRVSNFRIINNININRISTHITKSNLNNQNQIKNRNKNTTNKNMKSKSRKSKTKIFNSNKKSHNKYNNYELNNLSYDNAILYDKRTCFQYYFYLLKSKILILFGFCPLKDYNSRIIKLCIFFLSFSIYYAINFAFFNEKMIHKIFEDGGEYNIIYFLPKISISFIVSHIISIIIRFIFLSERNLMKIKIQASLEASENIAFNERRNLVCKYVIFFTLSFIFLGFFWFLLSSFGAVYQNTQIFIFENTLISFSISIIFEMFINIFPSIFRLASLRSKTKSRNYIYTLSKILQLL